MDTLVEKPTQATDFIEAYNLSKTRKKLSRGLRGSPNKLGRMLNSAMGFRMRFGDLEIGKNDGLYTIRFSSDNYRERNYDSFVLAPFEDHRFFKKLSGRKFVSRFVKETWNPFISLAYSSYQGKKEEDSTCVFINYIQSTNRINQEVYSDLTSALGGNPHEFLLAHFLARLSPILDVMPDTDVIMDEKYVGHPVYRRLRDRFFDKNYNLNPNKERVRQILGEENSWIQSRK